MQVSAEEDEDKKTKSIKVEGSKCMQTIYSNNNNKKAYLIFFFLISFFRKRVALICWIAVVRVALFLNE